MADESPLAGLLDRAGNVFSLAGKLGRAFHEEGQSRAIFFDPTIWQRHAPTFNEFCAALLDLREPMQNPPDGFGPVAQHLLQAAKLAKGIRDTLGRDGGFTDYLDYFPSLNTVFQSGWEAVKEVSKARLPDDPLAFVDEPKAPALSLLDRQKIKAKLAAEPASNAGPDSPTGFLGGAALADALAVHSTQRDAFFQRLMRQRMSLGDDCWHEVRDPRPNSPRFLYRVDSPKLRDLAAGYKNPKPT
jgi:hypothetical protein